MNSIKRAAIASALFGMLLSVACASLLFVEEGSFLPRHAGLTTRAISFGSTAAVRDATDVISRDVRDAHSLESPCGNELVLKAPEGNVSYTYDAAHRTLMRASRGRTERLLTGVDSFSFSLLRPTPNGHGALVPASIGEARAVAFRWSRSRKLASAKLNSEDFQMGAIVLRNREPGSALREKTTVKGMLAAAEKISKRSQ